MSANILPRYRNNSVEQYTTTSFIQSHQPELLGPTPNNLAITGQPTLRQLTNQKDTTETHEAPNLTSAEGQTPAFSLHSPNIMLTGHTDEVLCCRFDNTGQRLVSGGMDSSIFIWDLKNKCQNTGVIRQTRNAVTELKFSSDNTELIAASADKTINIFDFELMLKTRKFAGHESYVNGIDSFKKGNEFLVSASNDRTLRLWDRREKEAVKVFQDDLQVLAVCCGNDHHSFYSGGIDNLVKTWDLRKEKPAASFPGHTDSVTSLAVSHEGSFLLSNSMDNTLRVWDLRPFSSAKGPLKVYRGHLHGYEKNLIRGAWNFNGRLVASGSSDKNAYVWDSNTKQVLLTLGGHEAAVNDVAFSPVQDIIASASSDQRVILTELPRLY